MPRHEYHLFVKVIFTSYITTKVRKRKFEDTVQWKRLNWVTHSKRFRLHFEDRRNFQNPFFPAWAKIIVHKRRDFWEGKRKDILGFWIFVECWIRKRNKIFRTAPIIPNFNIFSYVFNVQTGPPLSPMTPFSLSASYQNQFKTVSFRSGVRFISYIAFLNCYLQGDQIKRDPTQSLDAQGGEELFHGI